MQTRRIRARRASTIYTLQSIERIIKIIDDRVTYIIPAWAHADSCGISQGKRKISKFSKESFQSLLALSWYGEM